MNTWISVEKAEKLLGARRSRFFERMKRGEFTTRAAGTAANGKPRREILLESLPLEAQKKYFESAQTDAETGGSTSLSESPELSDAANAAGAGAPALPAAPSLIGAGNGAIGEANRRAEALGYVAAGKNRAEVRRREKQIAHDFGVSVRTLANWRRSFEKWGTAGLLRKERKRADRLWAAEPDAVARIEREYLQTYRPTIAHVYRKLQKEYLAHGYPEPSYSFVRRVCLSIDPALVSRFRIGERDFNDKFMPYTQRKAPDRPRMWVDFDHHPCDHMVVFPNGQIGRAWITVAQDLCTKEILGLYMTPDKPTGKGSYPGAEAIGLCLRHAILKKSDPAWPSYGVFDYAHCDLGKDFRSEYIRAVCADLGIEIKYTRGYHGASKELERFFGIMEDQTRHLPGYTGNSWKNNPERQRAIPQPLDAKKLMTLPEYETAIVKWITEEFHHAPSLSRSLNGMSPLEALKMHVERGFRAREVKNQRALDMLLMKRASKTVHRAGVSHFGRNFFAEEILPLQGQSVDIFWSPSNVGEIFAYQGAKFICRLTNRELVQFGASQETLERERQIKRNYRRHIEESHQRLLDRSQYKSDFEHAAAEQSREKLLSEERKKIAAGAAAPSVGLLLPKYAGAAKKLRAVKTDDQPISRFGTPEERKARREKREADAYKREAEREREMAPLWKAVELKCHGCGAKREDDAYLDQRQQACLGCYNDGDAVCKKCGASAHMYCPGCLRNHVHVSTQEIDEESPGRGAAAVTYRESLKQEHPDWPGLRSGHCVGCGQELRALMDQRQCYRCDREVCPGCSENHECAKHATPAREDDLAIG